MDAFQFRENVYFRTIRDIRQGEELLVRYGEIFEKALGFQFDVYSGEQRTYFQQHQQGLYICNGKTDVKNLKVYHDIF